MLQNTGKEIQGNTSVKLRQACKCRAKQSRRAKSQLSDWSYPGAVSAVPSLYFSLSCYRDALIIMSRVIIIIIAYSASSQKIASAGAWCHME